MTTLPDPSTLHTPTSLRDFIDSVPQVTAAGRSTDRFTTVCIEQYDEIAPMLAWLRQRAIVPVPSSLVIAWPDDQLRRAFHKEFS